MEHKFEPLSIMNRGENPTPESTPLKTSDVVVLGEDSLDQQENQQPTDSSERSVVRPIEVPLRPKEEVNGEQIHALFDSMFDEYVKVSLEEPHDYTLQVGSTEEKWSRDATGKVFLEQPSEPIYYKPYDHSQVISMKLRELERFTRGSLESGGLTIDAKFLPKKGLVSLDQLKKEFIKNYISEGINQAMHRYENSPAHITYGPATEETFETTKKFIEIFKHLGSGAIHAIQNAHTIFSGPIDVAPNARIHEASPAHPADPKNLEGDVLTMMVEEIKQ